MEASTLLSIGSIVLAFCTFVLTRLDKKEDSVKKNAKENHQELIEYQIREIKDDIKQILKKMDDNDTKTDKKINDAIEMHIKLYHSKNGKEGDE